MEPRSATRQGFPLLSLLLNIVLEVLVMAIREEKKIIKGIWIGKKSKTLLLADNVILYMLLLLSCFSRVQLCATP